MFKTIQKEENTLRLFVLWKIKYYMARAQTFSGDQHWPTLLRFHANGRNIVALLFAGHRTIEMLGLVVPKVWPVSNCTQQVPTSANIVVVPCKQTQQIDTIFLGPKMLGVVGQQCWVRLHEAQMINFDCFKASIFRSEKPMGVHLTS